MTSDDTCSLKSSECGEYVQVLVSRKSLICILYFLRPLEDEFLSFILIGCPRLLPHPFQLFFFLCVICGKVIIDDCIKVMTLGLRSIGKCGFRFWNADFRFCKRTRAPKSENGFAKLLSCTVVFFLLIMLARARLLFRRTVFQILFQISQKNGKKGDSKTNISALKSVFGFRVRL